MIPSRGLPGACAVLLAAGVGLALPLTASSGGESARSSSAAPITIVTKVDGDGRGTFTARGALVENGRAVVRRAVVNGRLNATETLIGAKGRIVLTSQQRCAAATGTWRVVSGTLDYARLTGQGTTTARPTCARPLGPVVIRHHGSADLPPPMLAQPGAWGGRTPQASVITFTVTPDGRSVTSVRATRYRYDCVRSDGQRTTEPSPAESRFPGPFAITEDRTFDLKTFNGTITGRFGPRGAEGTITVARTSPPNIQGQTTTCSASIPWTATNPPGPPPQALPGTYCGITAAGGGACVDVPASGREVRSLRAEIKLTCGLIARIPLSVSTTYAGPIAFGPDLSFRQSYSRTPSRSKASRSASPPQEPSTRTAGCQALSASRRSRSSATAGASSAARTAATPRGSSADLEPLRFSA